MHDNPTSDLDQAAVMLARSYRASQLAEQAEKLASLDQELAKTKAGERATQTEIQKLNQTIPLVEQQLQAKQTLLDKGLAPRMQVLELQQRLVEMQRDRDAQADHVSEAKAAISSLKRQRAQAEEQFTQGRLKELTEAEAKANALAQEFKKADQRETLQRLTAPVDGTVQQLTLHTLGGVVQPAQALMAIVPDSSKIEVEAMLQNKDIGFVQDGMEAVIKLETFPFTRYGTIPGRVTTVSSDAIERSTQSSPSPLVGEGRDEGGNGAMGRTSSLVYATRIALDRTTINVDGKIVNLTPGMAATVEIKTGKRKLIEFVLSPLLKMTGEAGRER
jgi:hemolysin D